MARSSSRFSNDLLPRRHLQRARLIDLSRAPAAWWCGLRSMRIGSSRTGKNHWRLKSTARVRAGFYVISRTPQVATHATRASSGQVNCRRVGSHGIDPSPRLSIVRAFDWHTRVPDNFSTLHQHLVGAFWQPILRPCCCRPAASWRSNDLGRGPRAFLKRLARKDVPSTCALRWFHGAKKSRPGCLRCSAAHLLAAPGSQATDASKRAVTFT